MGKPDAPEPTPPTEVASGQNSTNISTAIANAFLQNANQYTPDGSLTFDFQGGGTAPSIEEFSRLVGGGTAPAGQDNGLPPDAVYDPMSGWQYATGGTIPGSAGIPGGPTGGGQVTPGVESTFYRVGDQEFDDRALAEQHRQGLVDEMGGYTFTDPYTGQTYTLPKITATQTLSPEAQKIKDRTDAAKLNLSDAAVSQTDTLKNTLANPLDLSTLPDLQNYTAQGAPVLQNYAPGADLTDMLSGAGDITNTFAANELSDYTTNIDLPDLTTSLTNTGQLNGTIANAGHIKKKLSLDRIGNLGQADASFDPDAYQRNIGQTDATRTSDFGNQGIRQSADVQGARFNYNPNATVNAGPVARRIGNVAGASRDIADTAGGIKYGFGDTGDVLSSFGNTGGGIQYSYNKDFSEERDEVEQALMERMDPLQQRDLAELEARLASQGLRIGSQPYMEAMDDYNRAQNDARLAAILNAGDEQTRLVNMARDAAMFNNSAQNQDYTQLFERAKFANDAQQQKYDQAFGRTELNNAAQLQDFNQNDRRSTFAADQQQREFDQAQARSQFINDAQSQVFNQGTTNLDRILDAAKFDTGTQLDNADLALRSNQQGIDRDSTAAYLGIDRANAQNDAQNQEFGQLLDAGIFANDATASANTDAATAAKLLADNQQFNIGMDYDTQLANRDAQGLEADFANTAQGQQFDQNKITTDTSNQALTDSLLNEISAGNFANTAQNDLFSAGYDNATLNNNVLNDLFSQTQDVAKFENAAQQQGFDQLLKEAGLTQAEIDNARAVIDQGNNNTLTGYDLGVAEDTRTTDQANQNRNQTLEEMLLQRNQPINEIAALLSGSQINQPNFVNPNISGIPTTDVAGIIGDYDNQQQQNYQQQMQQWNSLWGGILGLGAGGLSGGYI